MTPQDSREEWIVRQARERPPARRNDFLDGACAGDVALRQRVEALLAAQTEGGGIAGPTVTDPNAQGLRAEPLGEESLGAVIGRYKLLQKIGEGGCGVVYLAEQEEPVKRRVALKVIKLGMDTRQVVARFEAERQALALMDHPNIAKVLDGGTTEGGRPFFVMELVNGIPITRYCDERRLDTTQRLELFILVCRAIQHAHQKGIVHRDIKPSNILVADHEGAPVPKVIDFGIAKATAGQTLTDKTLFTALEQFIGTPAHMSPEQAELSGLDIDTRSDIYSLGVLLYELLTGKTPFDAKRLAQAGLEGICRIVREEEPPRPSTRLSTLEAAEQTTLARQRQVEPPKWVHLVRGDLDWIAMKCLEKDRNRRYETANGVAMDIKRHLKHEPVVARPPSMGYRLQKSIRRNRVVFTAAGAIGIASVLGGLFSTWQAVRATHEKRRADQAAGFAKTQRDRAETEAQRAKASEIAAREAAAEARQNLYAAEMNLAYRAWQENNLGWAVQVLDRHRPKETAASRPVLHSSTAEGGKQKAEMDLRGWEWRYLWQQCRSDELFVLGSHTNSVTTVCFAPDGKTLASGSYDQTVKIWDLGTHSLMRTFSHGGGLSSLAFSPDGKWLAAATTARADPARIWETSTWQLATNLPGTSSRLLAFSPDGKELAVGGAEGGAIWELKSHRQVTRFPCVGVEFCGQGVNYSHDGQLLVYDRKGFVCLWDVAAGKEIAALRGHTRGVNALVFSPDDKYLLSGAWDNTVRVWDAGTHRVEQILTNHTAWVSSVVFLPGGSTLATARR